MKQSLPSGEEKALSAEREGVRRAAGVSAGGAEVEVPDPEVRAKAKPRQFSAAYRLRIVREAEGCKTLGAIGALLRCEGLYSSNLVTWCRLRETRALTGMKAQKRGPEGREPTRDGS
jgi:transposase